MIILCTIFVLKFVGKTTLALKEKSSRIGQDELYADIKGLSLLATFTCKVPFHQG
jgi:hypothetical protein